MAEKYFVVLLADEGLPGHAFVNFGRESDALMSSVSDGTFGMYPQEGIKLVIGEVPGEIRDDYMRNKDYKLIVEVDKVEYDNCLQILVNWRGKTYVLLKGDCLSFVIEIAEAISSKIVAPARTGYDNLPAEWLKKLIQSN